MITSTEPSRPGHVEIDDDEQVQYVVGVLKAQGLASADVVQVAANGGAAGARARQARVKKLQRDGVEDKETKSEGEVMYMTGVGGRRFACTLPAHDVAKTDKAKARKEAKHGDGDGGEVDGSDAEGSGEGDVEEEQEEEEEEEEEEVEDPKVVAFRAMVERLKGSTLSESRCLTRVDGYWSYEVCPFRSVTQFRQEGKKRSIEMSLGRYDPSKEEVLEDEQVYYQHYTKGSDGRQTRVEYVCDDKALEAYKKLQRKKVSASQAKSHRWARLVEVREPKVRQYALTISTPIACTDKKVEEAPEMSVQPWKLLEPLQGRCVYYTAGWWTYEFCYQKSIRQYHTEAKAQTTKEKVGKDGKPVKSQKAKQVITMEFTLGEADHKMSRSELRRFSKLVKGATVSKTYVSQTYTDGTPCDLNGKPRSTEVRIFCGDGARSHIVAVKEVQTCEYVMSFVTPQLCKHPLFMPQRTRTRSITCVPVEEPNSPPA